VALAADLRARVAVLPPGRDPDGIFRENGAEELRRIMSQPLEAFEFLLQRGARQHDIGSAAGREAVTRSILEMIAGISKPVVRATHCQWLSQRLGIPENAIFEAMNQLLRGRRRGSRTRREHDPEPPAAREVALTASPLEPALLNLLDLALHCGPIAHSLAENEALTPAHFGNSAPEQALMLVLQKTAEDDWCNAAAAVGARQDLVSVPAITRILHDSRYAAPHPDMEERERQRVEHMLRKAMHDCLATIARLQLERERHQLSRQLEEEADPENLRQIMARLQQLARQHQRLGRTVSGGGKGRMKDEG